MSGTLVLPDDSIVVRRGDQVIHFCTRTGAVHVRAASAVAVTGGSLLASHPLGNIARLRLFRSGTGEGLTLVLGLKSGVTLELGDAPTQDVAMLTARLIADMTRCSIEFVQGDAAVMPERAATTDPADEAPTPPLVEAGAGPVVDPGAALAEPVFLQLLIESQLAAARDPRAPAEEGEDRQRALLELVRLASERLPVATSSPPLSLGEEPGAARRRSSSIG